MSISPLQALIIFAKSPSPGRVKTRLTPFLTPEQAAQLYDCMLRDTLASTARLPDTARFIFYLDDADALGYFRPLAEDATLFPQQGEDLGGRMAAAFRSIFALGYRQVAIIGSDSPDLPLDYLEQAFALLAADACEVVFGPTEDGGYYLLAMRELHEELFRDISWSSSSVLEISRLRAIEGKLRYTYLPLWYDIDTAADLQRPELLNEQNMAINTRELLSRLQR